jgi:hypothetical protein
MPANAIADAKTNLFMQCSWELSKWKSQLAPTPEKVEPSNLALSAVATDITIPRLTVLRRRIIESHAAPDKQVDA